MDSNKSKKVEHDLVNDDIELKHEEKDSNDAESIVENYNSGFLRRPQKFDNIYVLIWILQIKSAERFRLIFAAFI